MFVAFEVPDGQVEGALAAMRALGIDWLSVTMPHKTAAARGVDRITDDARILDAVNCIVDVGGVLEGDNTDGQGFVRALARDTGFAPGGSSCAVVGAGGAARAVVLALARAGAREVVVVNRSGVRAERAAALAGEAGRVGGIADVADVDLVVNATPVGMAGDDGSPFDVGPLAAHAIVADLVYEPETTPVVAAARARGLRAVNGLGMLVDQAALQFEKVVGQAAPIDAMLESARRALDAR